jgi:hypothetical protein
MKRLPVVLLFTALTVLLLSVPSPSAAGDCYGSRYYTTGHYSYYSAPQYYQPTYYPTYTQTYYPPAPASQTTCYNTPAGTVCNTNTNGQYASYNNAYNTPVETFYRVAPDLAQARIAQEASAETLKQFRIEMAAQAEATRKVEAEKRDSEFKAQVLQLLSASRVGVTGGPVVGGYDPDRDRLQAENAQLRATLDKLSKEMERMITQPPIPAPGPTTPKPTGSPVGPGTPTPAIEPPKPNPKPVGNPVDVVKATTAQYCMPCHQQQGRLNLTDPARLYYEDLADCINRLASDNPDFVMPKPSAGKGNLPLEAFQAFQRLSEKAPHRPVPQPLPMVPKIPESK